MLTDNANSTWVIADAGKYVRNPTTTSEIIVDNAAGTKSGTWLSRNGTSGGVFWGADFERTDTQGLGQTFTWTPTIAMAGLYRVYVRWAAHALYASNAPYTVHHDDGTTLVRMDQRHNGGQWNLLGRFAMTPSSGHKVVASDDADNFVVADAIRLVRIGDTRLVQADAVRITPNTAEDALYVHTDHLGAPRKMTDEARAVVWDADFRPFGEVDGITGSAANDNRFPGQYADAVAALHYNYFRDYDPTLGRYLQSDPIGLRGGLNTYGYVNGNPVNRVDPDGLIVDTLVDLGFIGYDLYRLASDYYAARFGACRILNDNLDENLAALGGDLLGFLIPGVTGVGLGIRGVGKGAKAANANKKYQPNKPGRKKQGREPGEKKRQNPKWKPRNPPKEPPRHTPSRKK